MNAHSIVVVWLALATPVGVLSAAARCPQGLSPRTSVELYFGRNIGEVVGITEDEWSKFLDEEITPRFPEGLTVFEIKGQWRDTPSGRIVREPGKLLRLIIEPKSDARSKLSAIVERYKSRFKQQSVLMTQHAACAKF
jgi:Protein of unknown function (DUF3574)